MGISAGLSIVTMPEIKKPYPTLLDFLVVRFPKIPAKTWINRIASGKVLSEEGHPVAMDMPYLPNKRLFYSREVDEEPLIPFQELILFNNDHLMVVCKPHFLPVIPGGPYVSESLINRLKEKTGNPFLSPINRIDRGTAGLVLISTNKETRGIYQQMFMDGQVQKTYEAVTHFSYGSGQTEWLVENRIESGEPWFRMKTCAGKPNACSRIRLVEFGKTQGRFQLIPVTGKKHQLRIHLSELGFPIVNDRYYPALLPEMPDDFNRPLQLLSKKIQFKDPVTGVRMAFESGRNLILESTTTAT